jgi:translation initiation factor 2 alpha subunit (eIF-2alpha)
MTPQPLKIRADIEMKCFQFDGVLHIKVQFSSLSFAFILLLWMVLMHMT